MQKLVVKEIEAGVILARSSDEVATNIRSYILAKEDDKIVGFCALHIHTQSLAEIRSLVVTENKRGMGIGQSLIAKAIEEAKALGLQKVLSLTYKQLFFEKLGFVEIPKESLPEHKIWADCIKCKHFPVCNEVSLIKTL
ncbi:MAG: GNAT family N-acetyltransferase [Sulfurimonas sp. RIFOXYD12_FULL_33_39]|uniref:N-acetyltransferase n=1 Tax=unclassified Sulfurimonas TaxID=2623549 RepID=UPI0008AC9762|nr:MULTISPECIES: N-acetyltransferase [unclassified Sulfurimonas]OHE09548.1 MAG: GNAT family N-acetyltransferase [Sulfurimonas sp. RIFOXYD12_FULL_33_39]OHE13036.1 MAG: GNAT family N-acetyltransferase [Sulfurimonas sp. RIFOXYD2_FULL_34_21]